MLHIIVNEKYLKNRKGLKKFNSTLEVFDRAGVEYTVHPTTKKGDAGEITSTVTQGTGNVVVVCGGDGTLHDVLNGFKNFENSLGIIPLGTGNDFAKSAGIPLKPGKAAELIVNSSPSPVDFIELSSGLRSLNAVGMGIDVDTLKKAYGGKNRKKSKYLKSLIASLIEFKSYNFTAEYEGRKERHSGLIGAVGNGRQIGGGIKICPEAKIDDGFLDLCIVDFISRRAIVRSFLKLMSGKVHKLKEATVIKVKSVKFIPHDTYTIQADGELYDNTPLEARISDSKLLLYYNKR